MLDQIIYTRCYPHRNLMEDGKVELDEGFGIFSFTESVSHLYPDEKELLSSCLQFPNGGAESLPENLFASYEYFPFSDGTAVIIHAQTKPCCTEKRRNGFSHRDGNFIKQAFIGEIQCYPFEWFGNSQWNAQFCSDNDFYMDCIENPVPPYLPQVQDVTPAEHKSPEWMRKKEEIRNFIAAGRQECLKEAACFVFQQFRVSEEERKVLLIKDTPQNVEKWITAISMGLPAEMAKQISFSTNMTNLSNAIESKLFFYTSQDGSFSKFRNGSSNLRRPYYLIVGYHPEDRNCNVRKLADSNFEVLDGISMQFSFSPDNSEIQKEYYQELVNFGEDMEDFSNVILPELDVSVPDDRIPELYAAYHYLMTEQDSGRRPQYDRTLISLKQFGITSNQIINQYLFRKVSQNYPDFWKEDAQNQYALLNFCWNLGGDKNLKYDIAEQMILKLQTPLNAEPINCARLQAFWKEFRMYAPAELKKLVLDNLFESSEAIQEYSRKLKNEKITAVELMFSVFYEMLKINRMLTREFTEDTEKYCFLLRLLVMAAKNKTTLERIFYELECPDFLMHRIIMDGAKILHHTADSELLMIWWDCALAASGCDVTELCRKLRNDNMMTPELLEQLIINRILRSGSCPPELFSTLLNCRQEEDTGKSIFCEWIEYTRKKQNFQEFVNIIYYIRKFRFPLETQKDLL
ncbi:MAG: hypothetical protein IJ644_01230, partial [Oscillospiraceae bacterium]|nr:hypothetical protein [Oscillospiraceae bacterium]